MSDNDTIQQQATPWPEVKVPMGVNIECHEFGLSGHGRLIWGEGHAKAPLMFLLDNPGARERSDGTPYVCGTRQTLRSAMIEAGLDSDRVFITFLLKCRPLRAYDREKARAVGLKYFSKQMQEQRPAVIVLFGDVVTQAVTGDEKASVKALRQSAMNIQETRTVVTYHPLATRRRPNLYPLLVADLVRARSLL